MNGQIFRYDGINWSVDTIKIFPYTNLPVQVNAVAVAGDNGIYIDIYQKDPSLGTEHYQFINFKWIGTCRSCHVATVDNSIGVNFYVI